MDPATVASAAGFREEAVEETGVSAPDAENAGEAQTDHRHELKRGPTGAGKPRWMRAATESPVAARFATLNS
jgi:hypothetical protein